MSPSEERGTTAPSPPPHSQPRRFAGPSEMVLASTVARRFYHDGCSKVEIAEELGLSRFKVARALELARESGIVRIDIRLPANIDPDLSDRLRAAYGLRRAIVVSGPRDAGGVRQQLGMVAADLLGEIVEGGDVLGLAWGRTLNALGAELSRLPSCTVVQLNGVLSHRAEGEGSVETVRHAAQLSGGPSFPIYAPLILPDATTARTLRDDPGVAAALAHAARLTKAVVAIGGWDSESSTVFTSLDPATRERYRELGVRAEISAQLFDLDGERVRTDLDDRVLSVTSEQLGAVPEVVAVAGGAGKAEAVGIALRTGLISTLVTDAAVAAALLG